MSHERVWLALVAVVLALMVAAWAYGLYCYVQMVRHRRPGIPAFSMLWPPEYLDQQGRSFRRRALRSYAGFALLALCLLLLHLILPS